MNHKRNRGDRRREPPALMAAIAAAESGGQVTLLEPNERLGKKLNITGKGRCNVTNNCSREELLAEHPPQRTLPLDGAFPRFDSAGRNGLFRGAGGAAEDRAGKPGLSPVGLRLRRIRGPAPPGVSGWGCDGSGTGPCPWKRRRAGSAALLEKRKRIQRRR